MSAALAARGTGEQHLALKAVTERDLNRAVAARHRVGLAQAIFMNRHQITAEQAITMLRRQSQTLM